MRTGNSSLKVSGNLKRKGKTISSWLLLWKKLKKGHPKRLKSNLHYHSPNIYFKLDCPSWWLTEAYKITHCHQTKAQLCLTEDRKISFSVFKPLSQKL